MLTKFIKLFICKYRWRKLNKHNDTKILELCNTDLIHVGRFTYGGIKALIHNDSARLIIKDFCSIGPGVTFVPSADHYLDRISTFPFKVKCLKTESTEAISKGDIIVENDVWIGCNAVVLSGVHIGQGAVIGAGAVVTKDIPPYSIALGVPAKVVKYRFSQDIIDELLKIDFEELNPDIISRHIENLYKPIQSIEQLDWINKKKR